MKTLLLTAACLLAFAPSAFAQADISGRWEVSPAKTTQADKALDLSGTWSLEVTTPNGIGRPTLVLKQTGEKLAGQYSSTYGEYNVTGTITGNEFTFTVPMAVEGNTVSIIYTGTADAATMKGTVTLGEMGEGTFVGKKK